MKTKTKIYTVLTVSILTVAAITGALLLTRPQLTGPFPCTSVVASFTFSPASPVVGESVTFDASASCDPDGTYLFYIWNYGDHVGEGAFGFRIRNYTYWAEGMYTVTLTVENRDKRTANATAEIVVLPSGQPVASFALSPSLPLVGESVTFDASVSSDPDGTIASYAWDFGDAATGSGVSVDHAYAAQGAYTVTLTVTDSIGATASATAEIAVGPVSGPTWQLVVSYGGSTGATTDPFLITGTKFRISWHVVGESGTGLAPFKFSWGFYEVGPPPGGLSFGGIDFHEPGEHSGSSVPVQGLGALNLFIEIGARNLSSWSFTIEEWR